MQNISSLAPKYYVYPESHFNMKSIHATGRTVIDYVATSNKESESH